MLASRPPKDGCRFELANLIGAVDLSRKINPDVTKDNKSHFSSEKWGGALLAPFDFGNRCCDVMKKKFLAGGKRYGSKHAQWMYHQVSAGYSDCFENLVQDLKRLGDAQTMIENYVMERTTITKDILDDVREKKRDWYMGTVEALKYKVVTDAI